MQAVRTAALEFLDRAPNDLRVGTVVFNHEVRRIEPPSTDRAPARAVTERLQPSGGTATGEALASSLAVLERARGSAKPRPPAAVILISDGASTHGRDPIPLARRAKRLKIPVYTVALGTDQGTIQVPGRDGTPQTSDGAARSRRRCSEIARITGGRTFNASDGNEVSDGLRAARLAGRQEGRAAPGHGRVRRRRGAPAAGRRADVAALVRPPALRALEQRRLRPLEEASTL